MKNRGVVASLLLVVLLSLFLCPAAAYADAVAPVPDDADRLESVQIQNASETLLVKKSMKLTADFGKAASAVTVSWWSSDETVATVKNGTVKGLSAGTVTIGIKVRDKVQDVEVEDTVVIQVLQPVSGVKASAKKLSLMTGGSEEVTLIPSCKTDDYTFDPQFLFDENYLSCDYDEETMVLTVSASGSAVKSTALTVKDAVSGKSVKLTVSVGAPADCVTTTMKTTEVDLLAGKSVSLKAAAAIAGSSVKPVTTAVVWSSSDESVAVVDQKGKVTAKGLGSCTISAAAVSAVPGTEPLDFSVSIMPKLKSFALYDENNKKLSKLTAVAGGDPIQMSSFIRENSIVFDKVSAEEAADYYTISYSAAVPASVAELDEETGELTAYGAGSAKVTVTLTCGSQKKAVSVTVTIGQAADIVTTSMNTEINIIAGKTATLKAAAAIEGSSAKPINTAVVWESDDETVALIDQKGKVTAKGLGSCTITATAVQAAAGTQPLVFLVTVSPQLKSFTLYDGSAKLTKLELECYSSVDLRRFITENSLAAGGYVLEEGVHYTLSFVSEDENVAAFTEDGILTGMEEGKVNVTVTASCGAVSKSVKVAVDILPAAELPMLVESFTLYQEDGTPLSSLTIAPGASVDLSSYITGASVLFYEDAEIPSNLNVEYSYSSADETVAAFDGSVLTALQEGSADVYVDVVYGRPGDLLSIGGTWVVSVTVGETAIPMSRAELCMEISVHWPIDIEMISYIPHSFTDVASDAEYYNAVYFCYAYDWVSGTSETLFEPEKTVTRAELAVAVADLVEQKWGYEAPAVSPFADVAEDDPAYAAICKAVHFGLLTASENGVFGPDAPAYVGDVDWSVPLFDGGHVIIAGEGPLSLTPKNGETRDVMRVTQASAQLVSGPYLILTVEYEAPFGTRVYLEDSAETKKFRIAGGTADGRLGCFRAVVETEDVRGAESIRFVFEDDTDAYWIEIDKAALLEMMEENDFRFFLYESGEVGIFQLDPDGLPEEAEYARACVYDSGMDLVPLTDRVYGSCAMIFDDMLLNLDAGSYSGISVSYLYTDENQQEQLLADTGFETTGNITASSVVSDITVSCALNSEFSDEYDFTINNYSSDVLYCEICLYNDTDEAPVRTINKYMLNFSDGVQQCVPVDIFGPSGIAYYTVDVLKDVSVSEDGRSLSFTHAVKGKTLAGSSDR